MFALLQVVTVLIVMTFLAIYSDSNVLVYVMVACGWLAANAFIIPILNLGVPPTLQIVVLLGLNVILPIVIFKGDNLDWLAV